MRQFSIATVCLLLLPALAAQTQEGAGQVPGPRAPTPLTIPYEVDLPLPLPTLNSPGELLQWVQQIKKATALALREARSRRNGAAVSRILVDLEHVRRHAYQTLKRFQDGASAPQKGAPEVPPKS